MLNHLARESNSSLGSRVAESSIRYWGNASIRAAMVRGASNVVPASTFNDAGTRDEASNGCDGQSSFIVTATLLLPCN